MTRFATILQTLLPLLLLVGLAVSFAGIETQNVAYPTASASDRLVAAHDCWTSSGPVGVIPGHAVLVKRGEARYVGGKAASRALEQAVGAADHGLTVAALCR